MTAIVLLIVAGGVVACGFLAAFAWAVTTGQFDDTVTPPIRVLLDDAGRSTHATPEDAPDVRPRS